MNKKCPDCNGNKVIPIDNGREIIRMMIAKHVKIQGKWVTHLMNGLKN